jgi:hypothetical protein
MTKAYEYAVAQFLRHRGGTLELARAARREDPGSAAAHLLEACLLLCSRDRRDFEAAARVLARAQGLAMGERERAHFAAASAAAGGDYARACRILEGAIERSPLDLVALAVAHVFDYFLGNPAALRERSARVLKAIPSDLPGYHAVLSMHAFALQECGEYDAAEIAARAAVRLEPQDLRAWHAVVHVLEMQGRAEEGLRWLEQGRPMWSGCGPASTHLWWHRALFHLQLGEAGRAAALYDARIAGAGSLSELIDGSAILWRLHLQGVKVSFDPLARRWAPYAEDAHCAFNDIHAMMAFAGAGRWDLAARLLAAQERRLAAGEGTNYDMTRLVGYPACRALAAYGRGDFAAARMLLRALPPVAHRIGGSHAQRDILQLTRAAANEEKRVLPPIVTARPARPAAPRSAPRSADGLRTGLGISTGFA